MVFFFLLNILKYFVEVSCHTNFSVEVSICHMNFLFEFLSLFLSLVYAYLQRFFSLSLLHLFLFSFCCMKIHQHVFFVFYMPYLSRSIIKNWWSPFLFFAHPPVNNNTCLRCILPWPFSLWSLLYKFSW